MDVDQLGYIRPVCKLVFCVHGSHNLVCTSVATFSDGRLQLLARCGCGLSSVYTGLVEVFRHGRRVVQRHWIAGGLVPVGVEYGQR